MNLSSEKGITIIDIILSVILISIFITIITVISGSIEKSNSNIQRDNEALYYAIDTIETIKGSDFSILPKVGTDKIQDKQNRSYGYITDKNGENTPYYRTITVQDYTETEKGKGKEAEVLKKVTVEIQYKQDNKNKTITLSTIKTKGD